MYGATNYETNESCPEAGATLGDVGALLAIQTNDGVFDVTAFDFHLKVLHDHDQERMSRFF